PLRRDWILKRNDVEEIAGRKVQPIDDGYLSDAHAKHSAKRNGSSKLGAGSLELGRKALRAKSHAVTQLAYARQGIITPEMEFIAIRENGGRVTRGLEPPRSMREGFEPSVQVGPGAGIEPANSSPVGEAASFPSNNNRDANTAPYSRNDLRQQH